MLDAGNEAVRLARTRPGDDEDGAEGRFDGEALLGKGSEAHPLLILRSKVTSVTVWHAVCLSFDGVIALVTALALALSGPPPTPPARLVVEPGLLSRLQTLAAGLHNEIVLCLTGATNGDTAVAGGFPIAPPPPPAAPHPTVGPRPQETNPSVHTHPPPTPGPRA